MKKKVIYPGTFDPITNGHLDLVTRASKIFDQVILAISSNPSKLPLFNLKERIMLANKATSHLSNVKVRGIINKLTTNFAEQQKSNILIRGLRSFSDFEYEMKLAKINSYLAPKIESIFMIPSDSFSFLSSTFVKEVAMNKGNISNFLPSSILNIVMKKLNINI